ncbi:hypothetical protein [Streptomyces sp. NPDC087270]|uniref:hypothetical protein n=1 Tax=Streptomyces sp. NPDC087270 TaxID=3365774 RepID=UPI0037FEF7A2
MRGRMVAQCERRSRTVRSPQGGAAQGSTGKRYSNHFASAITIRDHGITHWRDCLAPLAVLDALGADVPVRAAN